MENLGIEGVGVVVGVVLVEDIRCCWGLILFIYLHVSIISFIKGINFTSCIIITLIIYYQFTI